MAESETPDEAEKIATLRVVTNLDSDDEARRRLVYANWDLQVAVEMFLAGRDIPANPVRVAGTGAAQGGSPAAPQQPGPLDLDERMSRGLSRRSTSRGSSANGTPVRGGWKMVLRILFFPFKAALSIVSYISNTFSSFLGLGQLTIEGETPTQATARFICSFEEKYGSRHPRFETGSYAEALASAERQFKFLLVYLHSDRHYRTAKFCREVLADESFCRFVNESFVVWGGSVSSQEAAAAQHALSMTTFPFVAVVGARRGRPYGRRIAANQGPTTAAALQGTLQAVLERHGTSLVAARLEQEERANTRALREEQDREYERSLEADRARERALQEKAAQEALESAQAAQEEEERASKEALRVARRKEKAAALEARGEPEKGEPGSASVVIRLPDGSRASRRFRGDETLRVLFDWADVLGVEIELARLAMSYPRKSFDYPEDVDKSVAEGGLVPSAMLLIEERIDDSLNAS